ncbi:MAG: hypothetical protein Q7R35_04540 [Elusimicrobiota bacterium]|nr:hypothetical protein [Elusimicrobiota bacterium]
MKTKIFALVLLMTAFTAGCTPPVYHHSFTTNYDASGKVVGYVEEEGIEQTDPSSSPLKVKINNPGKLEK